MNQSVLILFFLLAATYAHTGDAREADVKASFLLHFSNYITWPESAFSDGNAPLVIGVYGKSPLEAVEFEKRATARRLESGRRVAVRFLKRIEDCRECHVVFVSPSEAGNFSEILAELRVNHILTVGDTESFCEKGGMIGFFNSQGRIRFAINPEEAERAKLKISSELLKLAKIVKTKQ